MGIKQTPFIKAPALLPGYFDTNPLQTPCPDLTRTTIVDISSYRPKMIFDEKYRKPDKNPTRNTENLPYFLLDMMMHTQPARRVVPFWPALAIALYVMDRQRSNGCRGTYREHSVLTDTRSFLCMTSTKTPEPIHHVLKFP